MIGAISSTSVQHPGALPGVVSPFASNASVAPAVTAIAIGANRPEHKASMAALAPAAMSALIQAQESMGRDATPAARTQTAQKIDQLLTQLDGGAPPMPPATAEPSFSIQMLLTARQQLNPVYA